MLTHTQSLQYHAEPQRVCWNTLAETDSADNEEEAFCHHFPPAFILMMLYSALLNKGST